MAHMMAQNQRPGFLGTPEEQSFMARLLGDQQGDPVLRRLLAGQQGDPSSWLSPDGRRNPAGQLFTGGPGHPTPELPGRPTTTPSPTTPGTTGPIGPIGEPGDPPTPMIFPPIPGPPPPDVERPEDDDTPIDLPPETEEEDIYVDANGNGIPDIYEPWYPGPTPTPTPTDPYYYPPPSPGGNVAYGGAGGHGGAGGAGGAGGTATGGDATISGFAPVFNINANPAQRAVDVTMDAWDQYQKALMDKYYADTLRDLGMAALGGGAGGGRDVVGPVGYANLVTGGFGRYQQPKPIVEKERSRRKPKQPKNPTPPPGPVPPPIPRIAMAGEPAAEGEPGGFEPGQFLADVQADAGGDVAGRSFLPPIPPREDERPSEEDWSDRDTEKFLEKMNEPPGAGSGMMVDPGYQPGKLTVPNPMALASLQQRPPEVEEPGPIYRSTPGARPGQTYNRPRPPIPPRPPWPGQAPAAAADPLAGQMGDIMSGAGVPMGGAIAAQINKQGQANEWDNLVKANERGLRIAQTGYGFKGQERSLQEAQDQFRQQKAQDVMANLKSKMGQRGGPRTRVRVQA